MPRRPSRRSWWASLLAHASSSFPFSSSFSSLRKSNSPDGSDGAFGSILVETSSSSKAFSTFSRSLTTAFCTLQRFHLRFVDTPWSFAYVRFLAATLLAAQHWTVVWHAGSSGAVTMDRSSRRAEGLARSLSKAGGINFEGKERGGNPLTSGARAVALSRSSQLLERPMRLAVRQCQASLLLLPDHSTQPHFDRHSTKPPIAPAPPHIHLSTLHNGRVRPLCSCATRPRRQLTPARRLLPPHSHSQY